MPGNKGILGARSTQAVIDEAADWVVRMGASDVSVAEKHEFVAWLKRSPVNLGEYLNLERTWAGFCGMEGARRIDVEALLAAAQDNVVELTRAPEAVAPAVPANQNMRRVAFAVAAVAAMMIVGMIWWQAQFAHRYSTGVGEQRTVKLDDGSTLVLNTDTELRVAFSSDLREIHLLSGEALFDVAKDAARPFRVISNKAIAQAVGTSFIVRQQALQTIVTVIEGQVAVTRAPGDVTPEQSLSQAVRVSAGVRADVADRGITTNEVENPAAVVAWRTGHLIFDGDSLANVVAEFNRYNKVQLVLQDPALAEHRLSGVFDAGQPLGLVRFLEHSGKVERAERSGDQIFLSPSR